MKFHTRDWLDNKELRRCSLAARAILADLMCLAHEGYPYGHLTDKLGPLTDDYLASRCVCSVAKLRDSIKQLRLALRIHETPSGTLYIKRMVEDEEIRLKRAAGGSLGGNPKLNRKVNLNNNHSRQSEVNGHSCERTGSGSDSGSSVGVTGGTPEKKPLSDLDGHQLFSLDEPPFDPPWEQEATRITEAMCSRHLARKCTRKCCREKLVLIVGVVPIPERVIMLRLIDSQHAKWCASWDWLRDGKQYTPGLDVWLNQRKWELEPDWPNGVGPPPKERKSRAEELMDSI